MSVEKWNANEKFTMNIIESKRIIDGLGYNKNELTLIEIRLNLEIWFVNFAFHVVQYLFVQHWTRNLLVLQMLLEFVHRQIHNQPLYDCDKREIYWINIFKTFG